MDKRFGQFCLFDLVLVDISLFLTQERLFADGTKNINSLAMNTLRAITSSFYSSV